MVIFLLAALQHQKYPVLEIKLVLLIPIKEWVWTLGLLSALLHNVVLFLAPQFLTTYLLLLAINDFDVRF